MQEEIERIKIVKRKYEKQWLSIDGVIAIGIGFTKNKKTGLIISVKDLNVKVQQSIPNEVEGIPVEINVTGEIKAL